MTPRGTVNVALFDPSVSTVTPLGTGTATPSQTVAGWNTIDLTSPVTIVASHTYVAVAWLSLAPGSVQPNYTFINGGISSPVTVGDLTALNGRFQNNTASLTYPSTTSAFNFMVDVVFAPGTPAAAEGGRMYSSTAVATAGSTNAVASAASSVASATAV